MGKKKSGKKSGKKKGKKGKKSEPQITWKEALLAYQINLKEKALEDVRYEIRALEETNQRHKERNERLQSEQQHYMQLLLEQHREFEKRLAMEKEIDKDEVIEVMMEKWQSQRQEEKDIVDLKEQIARKEAETVNRERERTYWENYKDKGQTDHSLQIELLKRELIDMQTSFDEMAGHLLRTLESSKDEVATATQEALDKQKDLASEKAMAKLDKNSRQEVLDNDWLKRETEIHRREVEQMMKEVEITENKNIDIMSQLFECTVDDLKISRNFYLTQFEDDENLEKDGILENDLSQLKICKSDFMSRPPSSRLAAIEETLRRMETPRPEGTAGTVSQRALMPAQQEPRLEEEDGESDFDGDNGVEDSDEEDPFSAFYPFESDDFDDYLKLGPLELKLLNIKGESMPIHRPNTPPKEELAAKDCKPDDWPVTAHMLKQTVKLK